MSNNGTDLGELRQGLGELQKCRVIVHGKISELQLLLYETQWIEELIRHLDQIHVKVTDLNTPETRQLQAIAKSP
jgi:hypothetical protein